MIKDEFNKVYTKFKLHFYKKVFEKWKEREATLTTVETFCMEIIYSLGNPTIHEFAKMANLSSPNAAYKVNSLVKKGYLRRIRSEEDKREYHLEATEKYISYYNISYQYMDEVMKRIEKRFGSKELEILENVLTIMCDELMPEIDY